MISPQDPRYPEYTRIHAELFDEQGRDRSSGKKCSKEEIDRQVLARLDRKQRSNGSSPPAGVHEEPEQPNGHGDPFVASVPFMMTNKVKLALRDLGYSDEQIFEMPPAEAHQILNDAKAHAGEPDDDDAAGNGAVANGTEGGGDGAAANGGTEGGSARDYTVTLDPPTDGKAGAQSGRTGGEGVGQGPEGLRENPQNYHQQTASLDEWDVGEDIWPIPPRGWLLASQFCRKFVSALIAAGATGKSALRLLQYFSLVTGRALTGQHVFRRSRVLLVSFEDDRDELRRRIKAVLIRHQIKHDDIRGWFFCAAPKGLKFAEVRQKSRQAGQLEKVLRDAIERRKPDLVALDPFVKTHGLEENDNAAMDFVCDLMAKLAIEYDIAVDTPHHSKKGQQIPGDADAGRGASSARDAFRIVHTLTVMSEDEAKMFDVSEVDRRAYIRLDPAKVNIAPSAMKATWFKLVGVALGNGTTEYPNGDEVQTVEPWSPPDTWANLSSSALNEALTEIDGGLPNGQRFSSASAAKDRAAWRIVKKHCPDKTELQCRQIVNTWVKTGLLHNQDYDDPVDRKTVKGLYVDNTKRPT